MDENLEHIIRQALEEAQAANLSPVQRDARAIDAVRQVRPELSPLDVMVLINLIRKP
jgi:hypothetical protein